MTLVASKATSGRAARFRPDWRERREWRRSAVLVRVVQVVAGGAVFLLPAHHHTICDVLLILGLVTAVVSPARNGPGLALIGGLWGWLLSDGAYAHPPVDRVLPFAVAVLPEFIYAPTLR